MGALGWIDKVLKKVEENILDNNVLEKMKKTLSTFQ